jgi:hypothetical protein
VLVAVACACALAASAEAKGKGKGALPKITMGGVTRNDNSGVFPDALNMGGLTAEATDVGTVVAHAYFPVSITRYPARGEVEMKTVSAADPSVVFSTVHGKVVCIANLGPSSGIDGGGNPDLDVWEVRFRIERATLNGVPQDLSGPPVYGSLLVQDGGKTDYADESFAQDLALVPDCGNVAFFELEPQLKGNIKVHGE